MLTEIICVLQRNRNGLWWPNKIMFTIIFFESLSRFLWKRLEFWLFGNFLTEKKSKISRNFPSSPSQLFQTTALALGVERNHCWNRAWQVNVWHCSVQGRERGQSDEFRILSFEFKTEHLSSFPLLQRSFLCVALVVLIHWNYLSIRTIRFNRAFYVQSDNDRQKKTHRH